MTMTDRIGRPFYRSSINKLSVAGAICAGEQEAFDGPARTWCRRLRVY